MDYSAYGMNEERARILRMVESGDLSAAEAISLLDRLGSSARTTGSQAAENLAADDVPEDYLQEPLPQSPPEPQANEPRRANGSPQWLRVRVTDLDSGRSKVSVSIPFKLATWGLRAGARFTPRVEGVDLGALSQMLQNGAAQGLLVDVIDEEDGEHVQVFVE